MKLSWLLTLLFFVQLLVVHGQNAKDSVSIESTISWLERKMTFNYYDPTNQHWWVNRFQSNEDGTYTIKNIAAKHPDKVLEKKYHNRTFNLYDLNPHSVSVLDIPKDQGRFVKGKIVRVQCFGDEKKIAVKKDGITGSKVGFIHVSIPQILIDSSDVYAEKLKNKLAEAAFLDARLFNTNNLEENITSAFNAFRGRYISEDSTAYLDFEVIDVRLVRFTIKKDNDISIGTMGYDVKRKSIYFFLAGTKQYEIRDFSFDPQSNELILLAEGERLHIIGRNALGFQLSEFSAKFFRY